MTDDVHSRFKPDVNGKGVFLPWPIVVALLLSGLVPLWIGTASAVHVASQVDTVVENDREQDKRINKHGERLATLEAQR